MLPENFVEGDDINVVYKQLISKILLDGTQTNPRGLKCWELAPCMVHIPHIKNNLITVPGCETSEEYAKQEFLWYMSGSNKIADLGKFAKVWERFSDDGVHVNSAYGYNILGNNPDVGLNQLKWVLQKLQEDPDSRQLVININLPSYKRNPTKDFPCTIAIQFLQRYGCLDMFVMMRSNDAYYGFRNDYYCFTELLKRVAQLSNLKVGEYWHWATSMHLYLPQVEKMHTLAKNWPEYEALSLAYQNQGFMD